MMPLLQVLNHQSGRRSFLKRTSNRLHRGSFTLMEHFNFLKALPHSTLIRNFTQISTSNEQRYLFCGISASHWLTQESSTWVILAPGTFSTFRDVSPLSQLEGVPVREASGGWRPGALLSPLQ